LNNISHHHNKIVLVGFSGAGKSTIAKKIARAFNFLVLDTDKILEEKYRISVYDTFEKYGEETFRKLEYNILIDALQQENVVIATGGGASCSFDAMKRINETAFSIYIKLPPRLLAKRLFHAKVIRPLTKNKTEAELFDFVTEQLTIREHFYKQAQLTIRGGNIDISELILMIKPRIINH
jgi:shikimate kinase